MDIDKLSKLKLLRELEEKRGEWIFRAAYAKSDEEWQAACDMCDEIDEEILRLENGEI